MRLPPEWVGVSFLLQATYFLRALTIRRLELEAEFSVDAEGEAVEDDETDEVGGVAKASGSGVEELGDFDEEGEGENEKSKKGTGLEGLAGPKVVPKAKGEGEAEAEGDPLSRFRGQVIV
jgi:hypothetical protein